MKATSSLDLDYQIMFESSAVLFERAQTVLAGDSAHDSWRFVPFPVAFDRADGTLKWDLSGRPVIDYWMGHGALLCGHGYPPVIEAVSRQLSRGCHFGGLHEFQVRWAEIICEMVPSAEKVRFTSSGTEATLLALRIARAFTGRPTTLKLDGHFHGWHDESLVYFVPAESAGLNPDVGTHVRLADATDFDTVLDMLAAEDVAAIILEPGGGCSGGLPWDPMFLGRLRQATTKYGALLIFDEVISGFRYAPGGVQELCGFTPDLTVLAKILSGGLPGGAVAGRAEVMEVFGSGTQVGARKVRVPHTGTFNANPLSAAAGVAMLGSLRDGSAQKRAAENAETLVAGVNQAAQAEGIDAALYRESSIFHILLGPLKAGVSLTASPGVVALNRSRPDRYASLRRALLSHGVDSHPVHGWVSTAHDADTIEQTIDAFARSFRQLLDEDSELAR